MTYDEAVQTRVSVKSAINELKKHGMAVQLCGSTLPWISHLNASSCGTDKIRFPIRHSDQTVSGRAILNWLGY